jgi:hypothetical protein
MCAAHPELRAIMPIVYDIDLARRLVTAKGHGKISEQDMFAYQQDVWSRPEVAGFNELIDMSAVEIGNPPPAEDLRQLAAFSAAMDPTEPKSKFAIVAPQLLAFGLGRMYEAYRAMDPRSTKEVGVFRTVAEALAFLGVADEKLN